MITFENDFRALVFGANGGIGSAIVEELQGTPGCTNLKCVERQKYPNFDLTNESSIQDLADEFKQEGLQFDLIFDATGALEIDNHPPERSLKEVNLTNMANHFAVNAIGPALLLKHFSPLLSSGKRTIFATLGARVGSIGDNQLGGWMSYRASKAALNQIVKTASIELSRTRPKTVCVSVHPGTVETSLSQNYQTRHKKLTPEEAARQILRVLDNLQPHHSGHQLAYDGSIIPH
ncbi:SDR family NAD(P)-dependent oxidoreductase [Maritalea sp.]|uniref:SDR family NAD(P)-dependent oxidoreductase n=1 Tax=Maritalea sp. TaxID=2003361 RepID=UPI003EF4AC64